MNWYFLLGVVCGLASDLATRLICRHITRKAHIENQKMFRGIR